MSASHTECHTDEYRRAIRKLCAETTRRGVSRSEIAAELGVPAPTAYKHLRRLVDDDSEPIEHCPNPTNPLEYLYYPA